MKPFVGPLKLCDLYLSCPQYEAPENQTAIKNITKRIKMKKIRKKKKEEETNK